MDFFFIIDYIMPWLFLAGLALVMWLIGLLTVEFTRQGSFSSLLTWGLFTAVLTSALCAWFAWSFANIAEKNALAITLTVATVCFAAAFQPSFAALRNGHKLAKHVRAMAPVVVEIIAQQFDAIDNDKTGTITESKLDWAQTSLPLTEQEKKALAFARSQISEIGHVTGQHTSLVTVMHLIGNLPMTTLAPVTIYEYGISKVDLERYPQFVKQHYRHW
jgi:hypothetical protein